MCLDYIPEDGQDQNVISLRNKWSEQIVLYNFNKSSLKDLEMKMRIKQSLPSAFTIFICTSLPLFWIFSDTFLINFWFSLVNF